MKLNQKDRAVLVPATQVAAAIADGIANRNLERVLGQRHVGAGPGRCSGEVVGQDISHPELNSLDFRSAFLYITCSSLRIQLKK